MKKTKFRSPLLIYVSGLVAIGFLFISVSSLFEAQSSQGDPFFFLRKQAVWIVVGYILLLISSRLNLEFFQKYSFYIYLFSIVLLVAVLIPGLGVKVLGARRWFNLGPINIQPSEIFKLVSVIFFSALFADPKQSTFRNLFLFLIPAFALIVFEPNLSTALLCAAIVFSIYYLSGGPNFPLFLTFLIFFALGIALVVFSPYRLARFKTLLNQENNTDQNYHSQQIIISLASGGWSGKGIANSDQKYKFLPKISTDSILAIIGEETGFIGLSSLIYLFVSLINYLFKLAKLVTKPSEKLLISGLACWLSYQALINFSAIVSLIPLTGIPFPFISYGGSSLLTLFIAAGLVRNIEKRYLPLLYSNDANSKKNRSNRHSHHSRT
jgi:cell division protein FtsW